MQGKIWVGDDLEEAFEDQEQIELLKDMLRESGGEIDQALALLGKPVTNRMIDFCKQLMSEAALPLEGPTVIQPSVVPQGESAFWDAQWEALQKMTILSFQQPGPQHTSAGDALAPWPGDFDYKPLVTGSLQSVSDTSLDSATQNMLLDDGFEFTKEQNREIDNICAFGTVRRDEIEDYFDDEIIDVSKLNQVLSFFFYSLIYQLFFDETWALQQVTRIQSVQDLKDRQRQQVLLDSAIHIKNIDSLDRDYGQYYPYLLVLITVTEVSLWDILDEKSKDTPAKKFVENELRDLIQKKVTGTLNEYARLMHDFYGVTLNFPSDPTNFSIESGFEKKLHSEEVMKAWYNSMYAQPQARQTFQQGSAADQAQILLDDPDLQEQPGGDYSFEEKKNPDIFENLTPFRTEWSSDQLAIQANGNTTVWELSVGYPAGGAPHAGMRLSSIKHFTSDPMDCMIVLKEFGYYTPEPYETGQTQEALRANPEVLLRLQAAKDRFLVQLNAHDPCWLLALCGRFMSPELSENRLKIQYLNTLMSPDASNILEQAFQVCGEDVLRMGVSDLSADSKEDQEFFRPSAREWIISRYQYFQYLHSGKPREEIPLKIAVEIMRLSYFYHRYFERDLVSDVNTVVELTRLVHEIENHHRVKDFEALINRLDSLQCEGLFADDHSLQYLPLSLKGREVLRVAISFRLSDQRELLSPHLSKTVIQEMLGNYACRFDVSENDAHFWNQFSQYVMKKAHASQRLPSTPTLERILGQRDRLEAESGYEEFLKDAAVTMSMRKRRRKATSTGSVSVNALGVPAAMPSPVSQPLSAALPQWVIKAQEMHRPFVPQSPPSQLPAGPANPQLPMSRLPTWPANPQLPMSRLPTWPSKSDTPRSDCGASCVPSKAAAMAMIEANQKAYRAKQNESQPTRR